MVKKCRKKQRKRAPHTRERTEAAYFRTVPGTALIELDVDGETGQVSPKLACEVAYTSVTYPRSNPQKGDKVVNKLFAPSGEPMLDADAAFQLFDFKVAIDTNTKQSNGRSRSVVGIVIGDRVRCGTPYCIELADIAPGFEERVGWKLALEHLVGDGFLNPNLATLVIVDAHLGEIEKINRREQSLFEDLMLPPGWVVAYASADSGSEFFANRMIIAADRVANRVWSHLDRSGIELCSGPLFSNLYGEPRKIYPKNGFSNWAELRAASSRSEEDVGARSSGVLGTL